MEIQTPEDHPREAAAASPNGPTPGAPSASPPSNKWRRRGRTFWREWIKPLFIIGAVMFSFRSAVADWNDVPTGSMKPTILEGDRIFINKLAYDLKVPFTRWRLAHWKDPSWGDVVVLLSPEDNKRLVKRVVGLPGDEIEIRGNHLYRNGEPAVYTALDQEIIEQIDAEDRPAFLFFSEDVAGREHPIMLSIGSAPHFPQGKFRVPTGQYFVMGDNRNNSRDSRYFGTVERSMILGRATAVALSLDYEDKLGKVIPRPRLDRFFSGLP